MTPKNPERNYTASTHNWQASVVEALDAVAHTTTSLPSAAIFERGSLQVKMYRPTERDAQQPHERDEVYFIASGSGWFVNGADRHAFKTGDMLFVPAGVIHRFEDFTSDFFTWVVFYGPQGGEQV